MPGTGNLAGQRVIHAIHTPHYKQALGHVMARADGVFLQLSVDEQCPNLEFYRPVLIAASNPLNLLPLSKADAVPLGRCSRDRRYPKQAEYADNGTFPHNVTLFRGLAEDKVVEHTRALKVSHGGKQTPGLRMKTRIV